jgi:Asp-tRNA(Asn)/Glu-tRNA(Gln) amidotransferase C subunit
MEASDVAALSRVIESIAEQSSVSLEPILSVFSELNQMGEKEVSLRLETQLNSTSLRRDVENAQ